MPKRKKYPKLPSGYGSIRYLGKNRKNCYAVHPPCNINNCDEHGRYIRPKALCYVDDWYVGFAVLNAYHAGTYKPGDELQFKQYRALSETDLDAFCRRLLTDYNADRHVEVVKKENEPTFADVYNQFFEWKYGERAAKKLSESSMRSTQAAFKNCSSVHDRIFRDLRLEDLQKCLDDCPLKKVSIGNIMLLLKQMYKFAIPRELCDKDYAQYLVMPDAEENEHGVPFTDDDLKVLWEHKTDPVIEMILIMCYSGYRIAAYKDIEVNLDEWYFRGGVKTQAGKGRIVPIHSAIQPLVVARMKRNGCMLTMTTAGFRNTFYRSLKSVGIEKHTPHDCRHTFSWLCEKYGVNENDRKRMLGHSFGGDITNGVYGHRTLDELRSEIEKIKTN
ncbi:MAG: integrase [Lachnospiraceae bacterium]|nr:integrase [Lachnospiraceae bacterium]